MALKDNYIYRPDQSYDDNPEILLKECKRRIEEKKQKIKDLENELDLLKQQAVNIYKKNVYYMLPGREIINSAIRWLHMVENGVDSDGNKLDKRKKYDDKVAYDTLNDQISSMIGYDISISNILEYNYGEAMIFEFSYEKYEWQLQIPNIPFIHVESFDQYGEECFKLKIWLRKSPSYIERLGSTFLEEELKDIISNKLQELEAQKENEKLEFSMNDINQAIENVDSRGISFREVKEGFSLD